MWEYVFWYINSISSLSDFEYVCLIGNYNQINGDERAQKLKERGYSDEQIKIALSQDQAEPSMVRSLDVRFQTSQAVNYPYFSYVLNLYLRSREGILPYPGGYAQQPAKIIDIFNVLEQLQHETEVRQRKEVEKEMKKRGRR